MTAASIETLLAPHGLRLRGIAELSAREIDYYGFETGANRLSVALAGNIGSSFWSVFTRSPEYLDGNPDPLDRWSRRIAEQLAPVLDATPVYPFQGPPYLPFQQWAQRAEPLRQSPIGLMMHPEYGLWHAYRFGLLIPGLEAPKPEPHNSPCEDCPNPPCLHSCPVGAYTRKGYDVPRCADYLNRNPGADCFEHGCMARFSCPVAHEYRYVDAQSRFHLMAFIGARLK